MVISYRNQSQKKFYDSKVEYLEFSGKQAIDLIDLTPNIYTTGKLTIEYQMTGVTKRQLSGSQSSYIEFCTSDGNFIGSANQIKCDMKRHTVVLDCTTDSNVGYYDDILLKNFGGYLRSTYDQPDRSFVLGSFRKPQFDFPCFFRVFSIRFQRMNADYNLNLIPVRITNENGLDEGVMFDRISQKFFRNIGKGSFICGPDLK